MIRAWIALALLAVSWLFGLGYYQPANLLAWTIVCALGTLLSASRPGPMPSRRESYLALALLVPAVCLMPWPFRAGPLLLAVGLALFELAPADRRRPARLGFGALTAGVVLVVQSLVMLVYATQTARSHDLPGPLAKLVGGVATALGANAAADGSTVAIHSMREVHRLAATWDLFLDPATLCFYLGGLVLLGLEACRTLAPGRRWATWLRSARRFSLVIACWLPIRLGLLLALYIHRASAADFGNPLTVMNQFLSPWVLLGMLAGPVLLSWRLVRLETPEDEDKDASRSESRLVPIIRRWHLPAATALMLSAVGIVSFTFGWDPVGRPGSGRVMFMERHSTWEPSTKTYNTTEYGELASYNYGAIYDYCSRFFDMSHLLEENKIDDAKLAECDVLVIKTPTSRYSLEEVHAIERFVASGGGLLLVGDHTDVFLTSTYLNDVVRPFGFKYRSDLLFRVGSPYAELHEPEVIPHPILQHLPAMHFAGSCTIDPGGSLGRAVVQTAGMWSLPPDYHSENFFPEAEYRPEMRYGPFIQLWATRHGTGRVLAFTDSTIFSNFSTFEPGKAELMLGMLDWLNRQSPLDARPGRLALVALLLVAAAVFLVFSLLLMQGRETAWVVLLAAGMCGWSVGSALVVFGHHRAMPRPRPVRQLETVIIDRTVSEVPLCRGGFLQEDGTGYGLFEQWIPRLGYFTKRASGSAAFTGDALIVFCPTRSVSDDYRRELVDYVADGGNLLVVDSPDSVGSTANSLLWPFGITSDHSTPPSGKLGLLQIWPDIELAASCHITGGEPLMWVDDVPVAARVSHGKGTVMAIGFGSLLNDNNMGRQGTERAVWMLEPEPDTLLRYNLLFALVRGLVTGQPVVPPAGKDALAPAT